MFDRSQGYRKEFGFYDFGERSVLRTTGESAGEIERQSAEKLPGRWSTMALGGKLHGMEQARKRTPRRNVAPRVFSDDDIAEARRIIGGLTAFECIIFQIRLAQPTAMSRAEVAADFGLTVEEVRLVELSVYEKVMRKSKRRSLAIVA